MIVDPASKAIVSQVNNLPNIITASPFEITGPTNAVRHVITFTRKAQVPYSIYKEDLTWDKHHWRWEHGVFSDPAWRSNYRAAMMNLNFRCEGIGT